MSEQRPVNRALMIAVPVLAIALALILFWPRGADPVPIPAAVPAPPPAPVVAAVAPEVPPAAVEKKVPSREDWEEERDDTVPSTKYCYDVMTLQWQGSPDFVIQDILRDRGYMFQMDDLACLSAEGASDVILGHVERYQDRRQFLEKYQEE